ncbi:MAG TPA: hypothetical protein DCM05_12255 [Elusimicrobia bacterium]|nr:hypothetical protein [Elusimicrobiota bacterium]
MSKKRLKTAAVPEPGRRRLLALALGLGALCWLSVLPGILFWDSEVLILNNVFLRSFEYLGKIWTTSVTAGGGEINNYYRPFPVTLLLLQYQLWGPSPVGYHAVSVLLHLLATALLFLWTERVSGSRKTAFLTSVLFCLHPVQNETVNYVDHFEGILALVFGLCALLAREGGRRLLSLAALALSLLCKEEGAVFFPILALRELFLVEEKPSLKALLRLWPEALLFGVYAGLRLSVFNFLDLPVTAFGAQKGAYAGLPLRLLTFAKALTTYLGLFVFPAGLHFDRDMAPVASLADLSAWGALALDGLVLGGLWRLSGRAGRWGLLWFLCGLLPYCGLLPFNNILAEHFLYIPSAGLLLTAALLLERLLKDAARTAALAAVCGVFLWQNTAYNRVWQSDERVYLRTLSGNPKSFRAANNLGTVYFKQKRLAEARQAFGLSLQANPAYPPALNNLGATAEAEGKLGEALEWYLRSAAAQESYALAHKNAAGALQRAGRLAEAESYARTALRYHPEYMEAWHILGITLFQQGRRQEGLDCLLKARSIGEDLDLNRNLAIVYKTLGEPEKAEAARRRYEAMGGK